MKITLQPLGSEDGKDILDVFNYYVENSFAAYPEQKLPYEFAGVFMDMCKGYPSAVARDESGAIAGFGMLRAYNSMPAFAKTAEISYFLKPEFTGKGIGKMILEHLVVKAKEKGITSILAGISSFNEGSIRFHLNNGFIECGRFKSIGTKKGRTFDVVYCQREL